MSTTDYATDSEHPKQHCAKRWSKNARQLVSDYIASRDSTKDQRAELRLLITKLAMVTGNSRDACRRFARQLGVSAKQPYRPWTRTEQQRLLDLIVLNPPCEVAKTLRRSTGSIRLMLHRLGANAQMGRDWFTKYSLAEALHIGVVQVQSWIDRGWLKVRIVETGRLKKEIIDADDFAEFCKQYRHAIVGRRLNVQCLDFVRRFVFPPSHTELLPVRESKKERAAYEAQTGGTKMPATAADFEESDDSGNLETA